MNNDRNIKYKKFEFPYKFDLVLIVIGLLAIFGGIFFFFNNYQSNEKASYLIVIIVLWVVGIISLGWGLKKLREEDIEDKKIRKLSRELKQLQYEKDIANLRKRK